MKVDEDILKKDLLQLLSEMELFDYYRGSKKLHLNSFSLKSAEFNDEYLKLLEFPSETPHNV